MKMTLWIGAAMLVATMTAPAFAQTTPPTDPMQQTPQQQMPPQQTSPVTDPAQTTPPDAMSPNTMPSNTTKPMSASDTRKWQECQAMTQDAMMKDSRCAKLMKKYPDMATTPPRG